MDAQKKLGKKGTLTIPQHLRHQLGFQGGTALDITATEDGGCCSRNIEPPATSAAAPMKW